MKNAQRCRRCMQRSPQSSSAQPRSVYKPPRQPARRSQHRSACKHHCRERQTGPLDTACVWRYHHMRGPPCTEHTRDLTMPLVGVFGTLMARHKLAGPCTRGRWCSSEPRTCTDPPGTEPGASSTRGSMSPSASSTPTRWSCTSSQRSKARRRSRPTSSWRPRTPSTRDPSSTCPPSSGPGPRGTCATRCTPAQTSRRPRRTCRTRTGCTTRSPPSRTILRCRWSTRRSRLRRRSRRCTASPWRCHRKSGLPGRPSTRG